MKKIIVSDEIFQEALNIADGVYCPVRGFIGKEDLRSVLDKMRLVSGEIWPMPILLDSDKKIDLRGEVLLETQDGRGIILENPASFTYYKDEIAKKLFGTSDENHPGVKRIKQMKKYFIAGTIGKVTTKSKRHSYYKTPRQTKNIFRRNNWNKVVAFQTRNAPHRSHEYLQKLALQKVDGLIVQPVIGPKKPGDFHNDHIIESYNILIDKYYPKNKTHLGTLHTFMRYAGPKEAVFHALVRKNFGCTHMIIGRDHAGVGDYYGPYDAQKIFDQFDPKELGITILKYDNTAYCPTCRKMRTDSECKHSKIFISGTALRQKFLAGEEIDKYFMRKEVSAYLRQNRDTLFVE